MASALPLHPLQRRFPGRGCETPGTPGLPGCGSRTLSPSSVCPSVAGVGRSGVAGSLSGSRPRVVELGLVLGGAQAADPAVAEGTGLSRHLPAQVAISGLATGAR